MKKENEKLTMDDLQEQHREYAQVIGLDNLLKLSDNFGGTSIYIPQRKELEKNRIYRLIYKEFDGSNLHELAKKYKVSKSTIYTIVSDKIGKCSYNIPGQMSILDWQNNTN